MNSQENNQKLGAQLAIELVADKWTIVVIHVLKHGTRRYSELQKELVGISQRMLIFTLRHMERDGLIKRRVYPVVPPKTEYSLTELGLSLWHPLHDLCLWAEQNYDQVTMARDRSALAAENRESD